MKVLSSLDERSVPPAPVAEVEHACVTLWSLLLAFVFSSLIFFFCTEKSEGREFALSAVSVIMMW